LGESDNNEKTLLHTSKRPTPRASGVFFCRPIVGETPATDKWQNRAHAALQSPRGACDAAAIDLKAERFTLYVPAQAPADGYALLALIMRPGSPPRRVWRSPLGSSKKEAAQWAASWT
jgi:hypothetical protein